jgi:hypothetical protein
MSCAFTSSPECSLTRISSAFLDDVIVGQDEPGRVEDESRAQATLRQTAPRHRALEETLEGAEVVRILSAASASASAARALGDAR